MTMKKYQYLVPYINRANTKSKIQPCNSFYQLKKESITSVEKKLGVKFPNQLINFYEEIGYGFLIRPHKYEIDYYFSNTNRINAPDTIEDILLNGQSSGLISQDTYELLEPGDLPFFEIGDSASFLVMRPNSDNPNAIWTDTGIKIEDSFEKFIWRLYYEDPAYYGQIIENHYAKQK
jgi:hypothetical protein